MMKIAIWGYGRYGRRMLDSLTRFCSEEYEVVRVYDAAYQKMKCTEGILSLPIHNPDDLLEDYGKGLFEKVLVSIFSYSQEPNKFLRKHTIPELSLGGPDDFYPLSSFEQGKKPFEIGRKGYDFFVLTNLYGAKANYNTKAILYLFDNKGRVVKEHNDIFNPDYFDRYMYPFVFKHSKAEKIFLEGQYCILTKQYSDNYWHFTYNNLEVVWLLEKAGFKGKYVVPVLGFASELLQLLEVPSERIITLDEFEHNKIYVFEEVFYIVAVKPFGEDLVYGSPVLIEAAKHIKKELPIDSSLPKKIYGKRIGKRKLLDADDILAEYGFSTMIPEDFSVKEQMTLFYNADIVFCVHGANSTNCLYMRKGTVFVEVFSSYWMNRCNLYAVASEGISYLPVSSLETVNNNNNGNFSDFLFPEALLRMTIENALNIFRAQNG